MKYSKNLILFAVLLLSYGSIAQISPPLKSVASSDYELLPVSNEIKVERRVTSLSFSLDGRNLAYRSGDHSVTNIQLKTGEQVWKAEDEQLEPMAMTFFASDARFLVVANNLYAGGKVMILNWKTGESVMKISPYGTGRNGLDFNPYHGSLAWAGPEGNVLAFDFSANDFASKGFQGHKEDLWALRFDWKGNIITAGLDGRVMRWNLIYPTEKGKPYRFQKDSSDFLYLCNKKLISLATYPLKKGYNGPPSDIIAVGGNKGDIMLVSAKTKQLEHYFVLPDGTATNMQYHPSDNDLLIITGKTNIHFYRFSTKSIDRSISHDAEISGFDISHLGDKMAVGLADGSIKIYALPASKPTIIPFDLYTMKSNASDEIKTGLASYMQTRIGTIDCMSVLSSEQRDNVAKASGTIMGTWSQNPYMAERTIGPMEADGYITSALMDSQNSGKYMLSFAYFTKEEGKVNYISKEVDANLSALKVAMDEHIREVCKFVN